MRWEWFEKRAARLRHEERLSVGGANEAVGEDVEERSEPIADALPPWLRGAMMPMASWYAARLEQAGFAGRAAVVPFLAWKAAAFVTGLLAASFILARRPFTPLAGPWADGLLVLIIGLVAAVGPEGVLARLGRLRGATTIARDLPFVLDLLVVLVESGVAFDGALSRLVAETERDPSPIEAELGRLRAEIEHGAPRPQAFRALAARSGVEEVETVVAAIVQSESMGGAIAPALRAQADALRNRRFEEARERAQKLPILLVFPLFTCIFPSLFIVTLGPSLIRVMELLGAVRR